MDGLKQIFNGDYAVSRNGEVFSLKSNKPLRQVDNGHGYKTVCLCIGGKPKKYYVHRLVAIAYLPNPFQYPEINHLDENRGNNCADNLEWCTAKYNKNYGRRAEKFSRSRGHPVVCVETGEVYCSCGEAERETGIKRGSIHSCCTKYRNAQSAGGLHWAFLKDFKPKSRADWTG